MKSFWWITWLLLTGVIIQSCKKSNDFTLKAELDNLHDEYLLAIHDEPEARIDTIYPREGKFVYTCLVDSFNGTFRLTNTVGATIPIYTLKGKQVELKGNFEHPQIKGTGENALYMDFIQSTSKISTSTEIAKIAEKWIQNHPQSKVSAYLINRYFVQVEHPDINHIRRLIDPLDGQIKDSPLIALALRSITGTKGQTDITYFPYITYKDRQGKYLTWGSEKDQITIVQLWASWDPNSITEREQLHQLLKDYTKNQLVVINISLDYDRNQWLSHCKDDNEQWKEYCDFKGFQTNVIQQLKIQELPYNIIINNTRQIKAKGLHGSELVQMIKTLTQKKVSGSTP